ncbi:MAG: DUF3098 domain-containing protein [Bacteroidia bacterium]|nr:DUF3098 domain-containing protein [Bacteroidia bacterium]
MDKKVNTKTATATTKTVATSNNSNNDLAFGRENYLLMGIGLVLIVIGFALMAGGKLEDPTAFNPEIFSFRRITLAPIVVMAGFLVEVWAIVKKSKD